MSKFYLDNFVNYGQDTTQRREMIRIELIGVVVLALASACPARAHTLYRCVPDGQMAAPDQRVSFEVAITPNGDFNSIIFRAADGTAYGRGQQFDEQNRQDGNGQHYWTGTSRTNPNVTIVGSLSGSGHRLVYSETISDRSLGNVQINSTCTPIVEWLASSVVRDFPPGPRSEPARSTTEGALKKAKYELFCKTAKVRNAIYLEGRAFAA